MSMLYTPFHDIYTCAFRSIIFHFKSQIQENQAVDLHNQRLLHNKTHNRCIKATRIQRITNKY